MENEHLLRERINTMLAEAIKKPLTIVCAGMGCGKTRAVYDFTLQCGISSFWVQLSKADNEEARFWENFVHTVAGVNPALAEEYHKIGVPDTDDKIRMYFSALDRGFENTRRIYIYDDVHLITNAGILDFFEKSINRLPPNRSVILISREMPDINISALMVRDKVSIINEDELNFTEGELRQFFLKQGLEAEMDRVSEIYHETGGWALIVNFVVRMLKKSPRNSAYARSVIRQDISKLLETEVWNVISERLKSLLLRLSLSDHSSTELVNILAEGDEGLISELKRQSAFIHFDIHTDSYHIHHFLLEFLHKRQGLLSDDEKQKTHKTIADWCIKNEYVVDALLYYEKTGDYASIIPILSASSSRFLRENVQLLLGILNRAPAAIFDQVESRLPCMCSWS